MKTFKTITINGVTYAVTDPDAATIEDTSIGAAAWSSKNIVDKLCPSFTESGAIVTCEPVEGYPLEVEWETKNLATTDILVGARGITENDGVFSGSANDFYQATKGGGLVKRRFEEGQQYVFSVYAKKELKDSSPYLRVRHTDGLSENIIITAIDDFERISVVSQPGKTVASVSLDYSVSDTTLYIKDIQVEKGTTATAYEPYAETATTITRCGKNLVSKLHSVNTQNGEFVGPAGVMNEYTMFNIELKQGKTYTVSCNQVADLISPPIRNTMIVTFPDGTRVYESPNNKQFAGLHSITFTANETGIYNIKYLVHTLSNEVTFNNFQLEVGNTATAYEPYRGDTFDPGEPILALSGVNTIFADAGLVTVTGRADPVAIIQDLYEKINTLQANAVNNV
jgi:hypothetical protein